MPSRRPSNPWPTTKTKLKIVADRLLEVQDIEGEGLLRLIQDEPPLITESTPLIDLAKKGIEHLEQEKPKMEIESPAPPKKAPPAPEPA